MEFLEIGVARDQSVAWKIYGNDLNGQYGGLQGIGGLQLIVEAGVADELGDGLHIAKPITDLQGHVTGLINMGARYYDPLIGRFISPDPYGHAGSIDLYSYANGNPIGYCDPDGRYMSSILEKTRDVYNKYEGDIVKVIDHAQTALDVAGMVPAYGAVPDLINAGIHGLRGNWLGVGTSAVAAVPIVGDFIAAGRMGMKTGQSVVKGVDNMAGTIGHISEQAPLSPLLLKAEKTADHHIFPRQFEQYFKNRKIDIDNFTVTLGQTHHLRGVHGKGIGNIPGRWNNEWSNFIKNNPGATAQEVYQFGGQLMSNFNINNLPIHLYKKP